MLFHIYYHCAGLIYRKLSIIIRPCKLIWMNQMIQFRQHCHFNSDGNTRCTPINHLV